MIRIYYHISLNLFVEKSIFRPNCRIDRFASLVFSNDWSLFIILDSSSGEIKSSISLRPFGYATGRFVEDCVRWTLSDRIQVFSSDWFISARWKQIRLSWFPLKSPVTNRVDCVASTITRLHSGHFNLNTTGNSFVTWFLGMNISNIILPYYRIRFFFR